MQLILGLGNPGKKYTNTRHNMGFIILDYLKDELFQDFSDWNKSKKFQAFTSEGNYNQEKLILAKPTTMMNNSGESAVLLANFYKIEPKNIIIIHDEIDLPLGRIKIQSDKSAAGHNGIKSIIEKLGTQEFTRVRVGIGKEKREHQGDTSDFVLRKFGFLEKLKLKEIKKTALWQIKLELETRS